ncbi:hypothetical protein CC86DRAFT_207386 [Ophiobolus disseminans]|uniref:Uncharacterized protein n=1 Tax=Ophiobolus disseminans TaxID=1469910 RepID=A0A6A7A6P8_9PLEO|nr:hypothetical protein CC86DRAFT_207386 [Ophiobolus disseminans]
MRHGHAPISLWNETQAQPGMKSDNPEMEIIDAVEQALMTAASLCMGCGGFLCMGCGAFSLCRVACGGLKEIRRTRRTP